MISSPLSSVYVSSDQEVESDDNSELTWSCSVDADNRSQRADSDSVKQSDNMSTKGGSPPSLPSESSLDERDIINDLKLQISKQQKEIATLSSRLRQCEIKNEALQTEKSVLMDELVSRRAPKKEQPTRRGWLSRSWTTNNNGTNANQHGNGGSMEMILNENSRLQAEADIMRKSFHSHIRGSQRTIENLQHDIRELRVQDEPPHSTVDSSLRRDDQDPYEDEESSLKDVMPLDLSERERKSLSVATATTSPLDVSDPDFVEDTNVPPESFENWFCNQVGSTSTDRNFKEDVKFGLLVDDSCDGLDNRLLPGTTKSVREYYAPVSKGPTRKYPDSLSGEANAKNSLTLGISESTRRKSADLLVDFGETPRRIRRPSRPSNNGTGTKLWHSLNEGYNPSGIPGELLGEL